MRNKFIISVGVLFSLILITNAPAQEPIYWDVVCAEDYGGGI